MVPKKNQLYSDTAKPLGWFGDTSPSLWKLPKVRKDTEMARSENAEVFQVHYSKSACWKFDVFVGAKGSCLRYLDVFWVAIIDFPPMCWYDDMMSKGWHSNTQNVTSGWFGKFFGLSSAWPKAPGAQTEGLGWLSLGAFFQVENGWQKKHTKIDLRVGLEMPFRV